MVSETIPSWETDLGRLGRAYGYDGGRQDALRTVATTPALRIEERGDVRGRQRPTMAFYSIAEPWPGLSHMTMPSKTSTVTK
jgi:hypothetical protein